MILCIGATPAVQRVMIFRKVELAAVNRAVTTQEGAAGKSINVAKVLKALGAKPLATGFLGGLRGGMIRGTLDAKGIPSEFLNPRVETRLCTTVIDQSTGAVTELVEESQPVEAAYYEQLTAVIRRHSPRCRALIMSGSLTPGAPQDFYRECTQIARELGKLSILDAQGPALTQAIKAQPSLVKLNRSELGATLGQALLDEAAVIRAMREVQRLGAARVVVTAGHLATLAVDEGGAWRIQPPRISAINPIGSGDSFTAGLVWRWLSDDDMGEACRWAAAAGAANALTAMPGELDIRDVQRLLEQVIVERLAGEQ